MKSLGILAVAIACLSSSAFAAKIIHPSDPDQPSSPLYQSYEFGTPLVYAAAPDMTPLPAIPNCQSADEVVAAAPAGVAIVQAGDSASGCYVGVPAILLVPAS